MHYFGVYDYNRDRFSYEFRCPSDEKGRDEFSYWYNVIVNPGRWEKRKLMRYFLVRFGSIVDGAEVPLDRPLVLMHDVEVRLSYKYFWHCDPPGNDAEQDEIDREFARLDALDQARLARHGNRNRAA